MSSLFRNTFTGLPTPNDFAHVEIDRLYRQWEHGIITAHEFQTRARGYDAAGIDSPEFSDVLNLMLMEEHDCIAAAEAADIQAERANSTDRWGYDGCP